MLKRLSKTSAQRGVTVVVDAGLATEENIAWLKEQGYRYLVVSRKRHRQFNDEHAVLVKDDGPLQVKAERVVNPHTGEVLLYCHSTAREAKEHAMDTLFAQRFEAALDGLAAGLGKKHTIKKYDKIIERIGRLKQQYGRIAHHYEITVEADEASGNACAIRWQRINPVERTHPGVYCLRTNQIDWDDTMAYLHHADRFGGGLSQSQIRTRSAAHLSSQDRSGERALVYLCPRLPSRAHYPPSA